MLSRLRSKCFQSAIIRAFQRYTRCKLKGEVGDSCRITLYLPWYTRWLVDVTRPPKALVNIESDDYYLRRSDYCMWDSVPFYLTVLKVYHPTRWSRQSLGVVIHVKRLLSLKEKIRQTENTV